LGTGVDDSKHCFEVVDRDCGARTFLINWVGGTKKVLWTFFARALKSKSEEEIETASTDFCLLAQWLIDGTRTFRFFVQS